MHRRGVCPDNEYWTDSDQQAFLFRGRHSTGRLALVFTEDPHDIAEFFVMRPYRGRRIGALAAASLFDRFPGRWAIRQQLTNPAAPLSGKGDPLPIPGR